MKCIIFLTMLFCPKSLVSCPKIGLPLEYKFMVALYISIPGYNHCIVLNVYLVYKILHKLAIIVVCFSS